MNLQDTVSIVTGSSSGVGAATARMLVQKGSRVVINFSRSVDAAQKVAEECESLGGEVMLCQADVSLDADCRRMVDVAMTKWGRLDVLVNNAG
ncbi:MAG TPA: oxidoreductase, partial [Gammaproteobacteria bacterium]|nr:oxidoreductase [Gammaproteobacteria bacterium]